MQAQPDPHQGQGPGGPRSEGGGQVEPVGPGSERDLIYGHWKTPGLIGAGGSPDANPIFHNDNNSRDE